MTTRQLIERTKASAIEREALPDEFILDKQTKFCVRPGDIIRSPWNKTNCWTVHQVEHLKNNGVRMTIIDNDNRRIYTTSASEWYNYIIEKENSNG